VFDAVLSSSVVTASNIEALPPADVQKATDAAADAYIAKYGSEVPDKSKIHDIMTSANTGIVAASTASTNGVVFSWQSITFTGGTATQIALDLSINLVTNLIADNSNSVTSIAELTNAAIQQVKEQVDGDLLGMLGYVWDEVKVYAIVLLVFIVLTIATILVLYGKRALQPKVVVK
jgi:hypothetical protein